MPFSIVRQDITKMKVNAIVNAANTNLQMGGGDCGAIFKAAGVQELQDACDKLAPIKTGEAVITPGFAIPAKYIIHTAGPVYHKYNAEKSEEFLRSAYINSLKIAVDYKCNSIAFPLISSGIYGYPKDEALRVATLAIHDFLSEHDIDVYLAVFDKATFEVSKTLLGEVESYIDEHYVNKHQTHRRDLLDFEFKTLDEAGGSTAILDAIGMTIHKIGNAQKYTADEYRAEKVIFVIITDGEENSSREYSSEKVKVQIERQKEKYGWEFIFLGANIDAVETANRFGIGADRAQNCHSDSEGVELNFSVMSEAVAAFRKTSAMPYDWNDKIQKDYKRRENKK